MTASDLNSSFTQITSNALSLISPLTGNLAAGSNKITGLAAATANGDAVRFEQITLPKNYIAGLVLSSDADADHDTAIAIGECRDYADSADLKNTAILTKRIDAVWAVGDDAGGLDTGTVAADTLYGVWLIRRSDTGVVDAMYSLDIDASSAPSNLPANYDEYRLIGPRLTDSSANIIDTLQIGDEFRFTGGIITDINDSTITSNTFEAGTLSVPPNSLAHVYFRVQNTTGTDNFIVGQLRTNGAADAAGSKTEALISIVINTLAGDMDEATVQGPVLVDGSSQVEYTADESTGSATVIISTLGFTMLTRSDPL